MGFFVVGQLNIVKTLHKYLSYIVRIVVEESSSPYNEKLIVAIQDGKYVLNTSNANYSFGSLHRVFQKAFRHIRLNKRNFSSCLLLGGGAGSVPVILYKELGLDINTTVVEIDSEVIRLGKKYFNTENHQNLSWINEDALLFVEKATTNFDLIAIDLFKDITVPEHFCKQAFIQQIKNILSPKGILLFNFVVYNKQSRQQFEQLVAAVEKVFQNNNNLQVLTLESMNKMLVVEAK